MKHLTVCSTAMFAGAMVAAGHGSAAAQTVQVGVGAEYSTGSYGGTADTIIYEAPVTVRVRTGDWAFRIRIPFASIEGPGGVVPGGPDDNGGIRNGNSGRGGSGSGGGSPASSGGSGGGSGKGSSGGGGNDDDEDEDESDSESEDESSLDDSLDPALGEVPGGVSSRGLADISLSATWSADLGGDNYLDLTGRVTLPTGDKNKNLGTGETDYTLLAEVGHDFDGGGVYAFGGYKLRGGATREDGGQFGAGGYLRILDSLITGVDAGWSESSIAGLDQSADITGYVNFPIFKDWRMSVYALTGLTDNAPDFGAGLTLTWRTNLRRPTED